jgi:hypothetical protein
MLFCGEMRRSTIWFLIACLWLIDVLLNIARGHERQIWLTAIITLAFIATGILYRLRERKTLGRGRLK